MFVFNLVIETQHFADKIVIVTLLAGNDNWRIGIVYIGRMCAIQIQISQILFIQTEAGRISERIDRQ